MPVAGRARVDGFSRGLPGQGAPISQAAQQDASDRRKPTDSELDLEAGGGRAGSILEDGGGFALLLVAGQPVALLCISLILGHECGGSGSHVLHSYWSLGGLRGGAPGATGGRNS